MRWLKAWLISARFKRVTAPYDRMITDARARHGQVRAAQRVKSAAVHDALRRGVRT